MKISEAFDLYKTNYLLPKHYSKRVVESHDWVKADIINNITNKRIRSLTLKDIALWSNSLEVMAMPGGNTRKRATNTVRSYINRLRGVIKYLNRVGVRCIDYQLIPVPKAEVVEVEFLYEDEVQAMINNAFSLRNQFVISLLYSSGIRLSELLSLNRDSIKNRTFTVIGKGNKSRVCFIDVRTEKLMQEYLDSRNDQSPALIISNQNKDRMTKTSVELLVRNTAKRAGIERRVTVHTLRHSFATNFLRNNGNIRYLCRMLGHSNISTTMIYTHVADNDLLSQYDHYHTI